MMMPVQTMPVQAPQPWPPRAASTSAPPPGGGFNPAPGPNWQPTVRGAMPEMDRQPVGMDRPLNVVQTPPPPLRLPSPEEAGVAVPAAVRVDWNLVHERLNQLGGVGLQMGRMEDGSYRITFMMRTRQANCFHHIEATAATESAAVEVAMTRAEQWASGR
jgi:hypothetical protein